PQPESVRSAAVASLLTVVADQRLGSCFPEGMPILQEPLALQKTSSLVRCDPQSRRIGQAWRTHRYILPAFIVTLLACAWFCTWGDWRFFEPEEFCRFYDAQAI